MTIFIFSAGLLVLVVLLVHFAFLSFPFTPSFHNTSSHVRHVGISRLSLYYASSQILISLTGVYENISLMMKVHFQICP